MPTVQSLRPFYIGWAVDSALAVALIGAVWQGGQFVQRFEVVAANLENLSGRVAQLEHHPLPNDTSRRVSVLETRHDNTERAIADLKQDLAKRLDRIELKLDKAL
jgi:pterin-4a-carbinolamine dehydratase